LYTSGFVAVGPAQANKQRPFLLTRVTSNDALVLHGTFV